MIDYLVIGNAVDTSAVTLPLELADGIHLTVADADMADSLREPLRALERRMDRSGLNKHPEATVLDRRVSARKFEEPLPKMSELFPEPIQLGPRGWLEYGHDGSDHYVVRHDVSPERTYHLIQLPAGDPQSVMSVIGALAVAEHPLLFPLGLVWDGRDAEEAEEHGHGWVPVGLDDGVIVELRHAWTTKALANPLVVDDEWRRSTRELIDNVRPIVRGEWLGIRSAFDRRLELRNVPVDSPLRHLGYFIVIEALLTHAPAQGDPADTLGRQLQTTLPLLSHRMPLEIPFGDLDPNVPPRALIKALYEYRSSIAHGNEPTFTGKQAALGSRERVGEFLDVTVRRLLQQAAREPLLVTDLKGPAR